ncbi:MAG TPA: hypothetical protein VLW48_02325 [Candidatus Bathyarchaeia archaeon]|nr:hypothetical protein [Candidatus Bathyarchaeia archaeon]
MQPSRTAVVSFLATILLGAGTLSAQTSGAMLFANGDVKVNGQPAGVSTSILAGDRVDVTGASAGSINRSGSSVVVRPNSSVQYSPASVQLLEGSARISTSKGMTAKVGEVVVSPQDAAAKFDVTRAGDKVVVASREGVVTVNDGAHTLTVQPGASAEVAWAPAGIQTAAVQSAQASQTDFLGQERLAEHPFYGVLNGVSTNPTALPICPSVTICLRPSVSNIHPCCCPPIVQCSH